MLICRNAEGEHGKKKVGNPCSRQSLKTPTPNGEEETVLVDP